MISVSRFGTLTIASCDSPQDLIDASNNLVDIVRIKGNHDQLLYSPESVRWIATLGKSVEEMFAEPKLLHYTAKARNNLSAAGWTFEVIELDRQSFEDFSSLYLQEVAKRERAKQVNIVDQTIGKSESGYKTLMFTAKDGGALKAGLIGYIKNNNFHVTLGAKTKLKGIKGGLGGILEVMLLDYCLEQGLQKISHGISINPAGLVTKPGLFEFKARYGYSAFPHGEWSTLLILNKEVITDDLILAGISDNTLCYTIFQAEQKQISRYETRGLDKLLSLSPEALIHKSDTIIKRCLK